MSVKCSLIDSYMNGLCDTNSLFANISSLSSHFPQVCFINVDALILGMSTSQATFQASSTQLDYARSQTRLVVSRAKLKLGLV